MDGEQYPPVTGTVCDPLLLEIVKLKGWPTAPFSPALQISIEPGFAGSFLTADATPAHIEARSTEVTTAPTNAAIHLGPRFIPSTFRSSLLPVEAQDPAAKAVNRRSACEPEMAGDGVTP